MDAIVRIFVAGEIRWNENIQIPKGTGDRNPRAHWYDVLERAPLGRTGCRPDATQQSSPIVAPYLQA